MQGLVWQHVTSTIVASHRLENMTIVLVVCVLKRQSIGVCDQIEVDSAGTLCLSVYTPKYHLYCVLFQASSISSWTQVSKSWVTCWRRLSSHCRDVITPFLRRLLTRPIRLPVPLVSLVDAPPLPHPNHPCHQVSHPPVCGGGVDRSHDC